MSKILLTLFFVCSSGFYLQAKAEDMSDKMSKEEFAAYLEGCKKGLSQAKPNWDHKDIEMLCTDPYLKGKANESAEDKARRLRLIKGTDEDKERMLMKSTQSKDYLKPCIDSYKAVDPGKDPEDVKMLCVNPYLTPTPNESAEAQARRKRLIREADAAKEKALDKFVVPAGSGDKKDTKPNGAVR